MSDCAICLEKKKGGLKCYQCKNIICFKCAGQIVKTCRLGCPCFRWRCPSCRTGNADIITNHRNPDLLLGILRDYMRIAQEDLEDEDNI